VEYVARMGNEKLVQNLSWVPWSEDNTMMYLKDRI